MIITRYPEKKNLMEKIQLSHIDSQPTGKMGNALEELKLSQ
jgi:hypothetical protein